MTALAINPVIREDAARIRDRLGERLRPLAGTRMLVTGASGFLCSYLVDVLVALGEDALTAPVHVVAADNFLRGKPARLAHLERHPAVEILSVDVTKELPMAPGFDWIVHGASIASPTFYRRFPLQTIDVNVNGTWRMLELARGGVEALLYLSTSEIYGDPDPQCIPTPETYRGNVSCTGPRACYDESKRLAETLCVTFHAEHGVPAKIVRPFNVYGPCQDLDDLRIIPDLIRALRRDEPIVLLSDGTATRSFCYVEDFVVGMLLVMLEGESASPYNVGNDDELSIADAAAVAARLRDGAPAEVDYAASDDPDYLVDNPDRRCPDLARARSLGYQPTVGLSEGLRRTLRSYE